MQARTLFKVMNIFVAQQPSTKHLKPTRMYAGGSGEAM
jgi:hypothetical protein